MAQSDQSAVGLYSSPLALHSDRLHRHYAALLVPRDETYMRELFQRHYPRGMFVNTDRSPEWRQSVGDAETIVLLYPDAIGFGFSRLEREARKLKSPQAALRFLNGRTRTMLLSRPVRRQFVVRRLLIRCFVFEALMAIPFLVLTLCFASADLVRRAR